MGRLVLDLEHVCAEHANEAFEYLIKAVGEDGDLWSPHPNPLVRRIVEVFTARGLQRSSDLTTELEAWLKGDRHRPGAEGPPRPEGAMQRWGPDELKLVKLYLEALRPDEFMISDWEMVVDYLVQRYLPAEDLRTEAEWLATRSTLMGRVQAAMGELDAEQADSVLAILPPLEMADGLGLTSAARAVLGFARARACENVGALSDSTRHRLKTIVVDHLEGVYTGDRRSGAAHSLETKLFDAGGQLNRDWRRIAVTEATNAVNSGFIASCQPGTKVRRVEQYGGACPYCRSINGLVLTVVSSDAADKDWDKSVWVGKTNSGRSASPKKRTADGLQDRTAEELWSIPAGAVHPNCRGSWVEVSGASADPEFDAWLEAQRTGRPA
jgi:hypothetical protein